MFLCVAIGSTPSLRDLYEHITPRCAADWKVIGTLLGIPNGELNAIEVGYPTNPKWCCNKMLEKWLEIDSTASWDKLSEAIKSPAVSANGNWPLLFNCMHELYRVRNKGLNCKSGKLRTNPVQFYLSCLLWCHLYLHAIGSRIFDAW